MDHAAEDLARALGSLSAPLRVIGREIVAEPTVSSTNDVASARAAAGAAEGLVVIADEQTAGRGRLGRTWASPAGAGLYVSVLLRPPHEVAGLLTLVGGLAIAEGLRESTGLPIEIKWPNDLLAPGSTRKLAGILVEATSTSGRLEYAVFGYGINLRPALYPAEVRARATSLAEELGRDVDAAQVLACTLGALDRRYHDLRQGNGRRLLERWQELAPRVRGTTVEWRDRQSVKSGVTAGIDDDGALLVRTGAGLERIVAGDVNWIQAEHST